MGPESEDPTKEAPQGPETPGVLPGTPRPDDMNWVFFGSHGLRAGWSLLIFGFLLFVLAPVFGTVLSFLVFDVKNLTVVSGSPLNTILGEGEWVDFFGRPAYTMTLVGRLQEASGAAIVCRWASSET